MTTPVIVIGAGPAGLSAAYALGRRGVPAHILERGNAVGDSWRHHYTALRLNSGRVVSSLPGRRLERRLGRWVARADFVAYLEEYAAGLDVAFEFGVNVGQINRDGRAWQVHTDQGPRRAETVIVATGLNARAHIPPWAVGNERITAAGDYRDAAPYRGRDVLVVGGGTTAHDLALDLVRGGAARVRMSMRTPPLLVPRSVLGVSSAVLSSLVKHCPSLPPRLLDRISLAMHRLWFPDADRLLGPPPAGVATALRERGHGAAVEAGILGAVRRGEVEVVSAVVVVRGDDVMLADGTVIRPDDVIVATGRGPSLEPMLGHLGVLGPDGRPLAHGARTMPHAPGLFFLGFRLPAGQLPDLSIDASAIARRVARAGPPVPLVAR